ncbi:hypothetical protein AVEN_270608-1 [Araneus ventricosus]|uniref:Uncharacterized protein n=1 Tax=Araneus ventricosus TaxID=182803 RepID=A0A4Y2DI95_ARAVE|nr:hypothetical protein AVEN_270608-1 [Araneus ventricosus]
MIHAAFQNSLASFRRSLVGFLQHIRSRRNQQLLLLGLAHKQLVKFPSLLVWQLLEFPRQWTSTPHTLPFHTFRRLNENYRRSRPCPLNGRPSKREGRPLKDNPMMRSQ